MKAEENEQLLELVSNALRDGPGSAAWEQATQLIDTGDGDELNALYQVRQRLESGKRWRQVRPGIGFTRKLMDAVDQQSDAKVRPTGPATIIAILCGLLILIVIAALVPMLLSHAKAPAPTTDEFSNIYFSTPWLQNDFTNSIGGDWRTTGNLKLQAAHGLRVSSPIPNDGAQWGIISVQSLPADQFFAFSSKLDIPTDGTTAQIFITDQKTELDAQVDADHIQVMLPGGQLIFTTPRPKETILQFRWLLSPASAALELNGQRIWTGSNNLSPDQPRFIGIRFAAHNQTSTAAAINSIDVRTKN